MKRTKLGVGGRTVVAVAAMGVAVAAYAASSVLKDINPTAATGSFPGDISGGVFPLGSKLLFSANTTGADPLIDHGTEAWITDGTVIGTVELNDINPGTGDSDPRDFTQFAGKSYFSATDDAANRQLYSTGGTPATTALAADFNPAADGNPTELVSTQGELWLQANVDDAGAFPGSPLGIEPVRFNGTRWEALDLVGGGDSTARHFRGVGSTVTFTGSNGAFDVLYVFSPTAANKTPSETATPKPTVMTAGAVTSSVGTVVQLALDEGTGTKPNVPLDTCDIDSPQDDGIVFGGRLYFVANVTNCTDGRPDPLISLLSYSPADKSYPAVFLSDEATPPDVGFARLVKSIPGGFVDVELGAATSSQLFFLADDGAHTGLELWRTNGTTAGTFLVKDINPATSGPLSDCGFAVIGNKLIGAADDGVNGAEPWVSDGTPAGTHVLRNINTAAAASSIDSACPFPSFDKVDSKVYFSADDGASGIEAWVTDGTELGTVLLADINPGAGDSTPRWFSSVANHLVYSADAGTASNAGQELMFDTLVVNTGSGTSGSGGGSGGGGGGSGGDGGGKGGGGGGGLDLLTLAGLAAAGMARRRRKTH